jgi:hypothetical protein
MQAFHGDLLIGGARLKHIHGELEQEAPQPDSGEWILAGHLHLRFDQSQLLETDRPYRLQLEDGRAGQVVVSRIVQDGKPDELLVDFLPKHRAGGTQ